MTTEKYPSDYAMDRVIEQAKRCEEIVKELIALMKGENKESL